jgi:hypothetical protein
MPLALAPRTDNVWLLPLLPSISKQTFGWNLTIIVLTRGKQ